jgi:hypothetical protein
MPIRHRHIKRTLAITALVLSTVGVASASASPPTTETVTMNWIRSGTGPTPPFTGTGLGTFSDAGPVTDTGTLTLVGQDVAVSSPVLAASRTDRELTGSQGTLELRCFEQTKTFSNPDSIPFIGSCSVVGGTGSYSRLHGHGNFTSAFLNLSTGAISEVLELNVSNVS